jgi:hypothetical protein
MKLGKPKKKPKAAPRTLIEQAIAVVASLLDRVQAAASSGELNTTVLRESALVARAASTLNDSIERNKRAAAKRFDKINEPTVHEWFAALPDDRQQAVLRQLTRMVANKERSGLA